MKTYAANLAVTATEITVTFPAGTWFVAEPAILITVLGAVTEVDAVLNVGAVSGIGNVYVSITLTFQAGAVGKRFSIMVTGE